MNVEYILKLFYDSFDFGLDTWSAFFRFENMFALFMTFIIVFMATKYFILPLVGLRVGSSDVVRRPRKDDKEK